MAIGSEKDFVYIPMTPNTEQLMADTLNCTLPTKRRLDLDPHFLALNESLRLYFQF